MSGSASLEFEGLEELKAWLKNLPASLTAEASGIVNAAANEAGRRIVDRYASGPTEDLKNKVVVQPMRLAPGGEFGIGLIVISKSDIAYLYENGSEVRFTGSGANRGKMPAQHVVVQEVTSHRREMYRKLMDMMVRQGLEVSGEP